MSSQLTAMVSVASVLLLLLSAHLSLGVHAGSQARTWLTNCDANTGAVIQLLQEQPALSLSETSSKNKTLQSTENSVEMDISVGSKLQRMEGYGAGLPQASAFVLSQLKQTQYSLYDYVLQSLFGPTDNSPSTIPRAGMNMLRFPIGSCDFSMANTSYDEVHDDFQLAAFAIDDDSQKYIVSVLQDVKKINPDLHLIASPWSAPSWMKVQQSLLGLSNSNTLIDDEAIYASYAQYFVRVLDAYEAQGLHIDYLTLQNEPLFGDSDQYPGMYLSAEQELRLAHKLAPLLHKRNVQLLGYDHNWDHPEYPQYLLKDRESTPFSGTAWHCYGGDMSVAQEKIHSQFPHVEQHLTECTGAYPNDVCDIKKGMTEFGFNHEWDMRNILLGAAAHWTSSGLKWILALDENCGPTLPLVTFKSGRALVAVPSYASSESDIYLNQDFWTIAHMSRFVTRNSHRVSSTVSMTGHGNALHAVKDIVLAESFLDSDTSVLSTIVMNLDHETPLHVVLTQGDKALEDTLPPFATKIYQWTI